MTWRATNYDAVKKCSFLFRLRARGARFGVPPRALALRGAVICYWARESAGGNGERGS